MPKPKRAAPTATTVAPALRTPSKDRNANGKFKAGNTARAVTGFTAPSTLDLSRARKTLNAMTIDTMTQCWREGGLEAMRKVMKNSPAQFAKLAVLLVPRELEVSHSGGVRGMSDEQLERGIEALEALMAKRAAGADAKVIEGTVAEDVSASDT